MLEPDHVAPPNDAGSDTFSRYCYQAHVAVAFCVESALQGTPQCLLPEHFEDLALDYGARWRMLQVKTRDPGLGPWKLAHVTGESGALRSLLRTYRALPGLDATYELVLEGAIASKDDIELLFTVSGRQDERLEASLCDRLELEPVECASFRERLRLRPAPGRVDIVSHNLRLLGSQAPHLPHADLATLHERVLAAVYGAMVADRLDADWPGCLIQEAAEEPGLARRIAAKRLTSEALRALLAPLSSPQRSLLRRVVDPDGAPVTALEEKLLAGGAPTQIVADAKSLRANAAMRESEIQAAAMWQDPELLEDVRERLRMRVNAFVANREDSQRPATEIWTDLVQTLPQHAVAIDGNRLFHQDADFLLGEICQMADLCLTDFGVARA